MKRKLAILFLSTLSLAGCVQEVKVGKIELAPPQSGNIVPIQKTTTDIQNIYIQFQDKFEVETAIADFKPKGIIPGTRSPMIPLSTKDSQLSALGFTTYISNDGNEARLTYNDSIIDLKVGSTNLFVNDKPGLQMPDAPIYNNTTIYVPIIPILDALKIDYVISGQDLTIGGMYTDDTGDTRRSEPNGDSSIR